MSVKLISLNVEGDRHLRQRVLPFLKRENPDVVCLQEVFADNLELIKTELNMTGKFLPLMKVNTPNYCLSTRGLWGLAILSKLPMSKIGHECYFGSETQIPQFNEKNPNSPNRAILWAKIRKSDQEFWIVTTHFIWSDGGQTTALQREAYAKMTKILNRFPDLILTGDFNVPRGEEIFGKLSWRYKDNIPPEVKTTIDNTLHKAQSEINLVVDGLFTSSKYTASGVKVVAGVSDHLAVVGKIDLCF